MQTNTTIGENNTSKETKEKKLIPQIEISLLIH